jgi:hypothetical protein
MEKELYRRLLMFVNTEAHYEALVEYSVVRIAILLQQLSTEKNIDRIREIQGAVAEIKRIATLRDEVLTGAK